MRTRFRPVRAGGSLSWRESFSDRLPRTKRPDRGANLGDSRETVRYYGRARGTVSLLSNQRSDRGPRESALARRVRPTNRPAVLISAVVIICCRRRAAKKIKLHNARVRRTRVPATVDGACPVREKALNQNTFFLPADLVRRRLCRRRCRCVSTAAGRFGKRVKRFRHPVHPKSLTGRLSSAFVHSHDIAYSLTDERRRRL